MKAQWTNKAIAIGSAGVLAVWGCCVVAMWSCAFDTSGLTRLLGILAALLATALAAPLPGRLARGFLRLAGRLNVKTTLSMQVATASAGPSSPQDMQEALRLVGLAAAVACAAAAAATGLIFAARPWIDALGREFVWTFGAWTLVRLVGMTLGMLPMAVGAVVLFLACALLRRGSAADAYGGVFREWLWGLSGGVACFALADLLGANLLGLSALAGVAMLTGAGVCLYLRRQMPRSPGGLGPVESPPLSNRAGVAGFYAALAAGALTQLRLLADVLDAPEAAQALWLAASGALLAGLLAHADHKSRPPGRLQWAGAVAGLMAVLATQICLMLASQGSPLRGLLGGLAAMLQIPALALLAGLISAQRRRLAERGCRPRCYLGCAAIGGAGGVAVFLLSGAAPYGRSILSACGVALYAGGVLAGISAGKRWTDQARWGLWGAVLLVALSGGVIASLNHARQAGGPARAGVWLTARDAPPPQPGSPTPNRPLDELQARIVQQTGGLWWRVAGDTATAGIEGHWPLTVVSAADPLAGPGSLTAGEEDFFTACRASGPLFDGLLLEAPDLSGPHGWRMVNDVALRQALGRLRPGGVLLVRLRARWSSLRALVAAVSAIEEAAGPCALVFCDGPDELDALVAGGECVLAGQRGAIPACELLRAYPQVPPLRPIRPQSIVRRIDADDFRAFLARRR